MTKICLCGRMSRKLGMPVADVKAIVDAFVDEVVEVMAEDQRIEIRGFGAFSVKRRMPRVCRNPRTGVAVPVPEYDAPTFKFSKDAMEAFRQKKASKPQTTGIAA